jgi:hypothetical protein
MIAAPIFYICLFIAIVLIARYVRSKPSAFLSRYWAVFVCICGLLITLLSIAGLVSNSRSINRFVAENHFQPDNFGGLVFLAVATVGVSLAVASAPFAIRQISRTKSTKRQKRPHRSRARR